MDQIIRPQSRGRQASPAELRLAVQLRQTAVSLGIVAGTVVILSLVILSLNWTKGNKIRSLNQSINVKNQTIEATFGKTVQQQELIRKQIEVLAQAEEELVDYRAGLWEELAKRAIKQVRIVSLALEGGRLTIEGQALSYSDIARQIISWRESSNFKNVKLESASGSEQGKRRFSASLDFKAVKTQNIK
jgi:Tfp pilus assembly protein PilN